MSFVHGAVAGLAGGLAGSWMMNRFQELAASIGNGREVADAPPGGPRGGRGPQPVQSDTHPSDDATARLAAAVAEPVLGRPLDHEERFEGGRAVHFAFGALTGAAYGAAAEAWPSSTTAAGLPFGIAVWAIADEGLVPALGLSRGPKSLSRTALAYGFLSHVVFGLTTECVRRLVRGARARDVAARR
jgi:hypothetical protein